MQTRGLLLVFSLLFFITSRGQENKSGILLPEFVVSDSNSYPPGYSSIIIPLNNTSSRLDQTLRVHAPVMVNNYGYTGITSVTFYGMNSEHTSIYWNGVPLQNPSIGSVDLSDYRQGLFSGISVHPGSGGAFLGVGGLGGSIDLSTKNLDSTSALSFQHMAGSFYRQEHIIKAGKVKKNYRQQFAGNYYSGRHNYSYSNYSKTSHPKERFSHNEMTFLGCSSDIEYTKNNWTYRNSLLANSSSRNLPGTIISPQSSSMDNRSLNLLLSAEKIEGRVQQSYKSAYIRSSNIFEDTLRNIHSTNIFNRFYQSMEISSSGSRNRLQIAVKYHYDRVISGGFQGYRDRHSTYIQAIWTRKIKKHLLFSAFTKPVLIDKDKYLLNGCSYQWNRLHQHGWYFSGNATQHLRYPSFNEQYWEPGGNLSLLPERGHSFEQKIAYNTQKNSKVIMSVQSNFYAKMVDNWIQWVPGENGDWQSQNVKKIMSKGTDLTFRIEKKGQLKIGAAVNGQFNDFRILAVSNQELSNQINMRPVFKPIWQGSFSSFVEKNSMIITYNQILTGKRWINSDNTGWLPPFTVGSLMLTRSMGKKKQFTCSFTIENIWNEEYHSLPWYPMPGRHYEVKITWHPNTFFSKRKTS